MKIKFLQIAIAQWEHNNKLKGVFHCTIGVNLNTNELVRIYPINLNQMYKHNVYEIEVEEMTCRRENSFKPISIKHLYKIDQLKTNEILNSINLTTISELNNNKLSMGIIDVSNKQIVVETNLNYVNDTQCDLFSGTEHSIEKSLDNKSYSNMVKKDIRIKFQTNETQQGFRDLSYNENHFFVGLEKNGSLPKFYQKDEWNRMIVGNLRNHRSTFIGLCLFKSK
jgi:hypothetical protein